MTRRRSAVRVCTGPPNVCNDRKGRRKSLGQEAPKKSNWTWKNSLTYQVATTLSIQKKGRADVSTHLSGGSQGQAIQDAGRRCESASKTRFTRFANSGISCSSLKPRIDPLTEGHQRITPAYIASVGIIPVLQPFPNELEPRVENLVSVCEQVCLESFWVV